MNCSEKAILDVILEEAGMSRRVLADRFNLTDYRLRRVFRHLERDLHGMNIVDDDVNGVWIVAVNPDRCKGVEWRGRDAGGYVQCSSPPAFLDGCCYVHSSCETPEMTAFETKLRCIAGPCEPTAYHLSRLTMTVVLELTESLKRIAPITLRERQRKTRLLEQLLSATAFLRWKEMMSARHDDERWIPPEFAERHRRSSGNSFEFVLRKHFVVLEISPDSTRDDVLKAWRKLARRYHPDLQAGGDEERMKIINLAKDRIFSIRGWDREPRR
jgi:DnaJ-domain-containing protein 1